ncbi:MAG: hypothetical protein QOE54_6115 [Streptosporangiaceae bacterium]|jgi:hypothetical protein|nr:hypothetical protein [Streptosporangiaceae bacterium]MDX6433749.1 hypothetical protein [Streptosporangiaceae bacterium]
MNVVRRTSCHAAIGLALITALGACGGGGTGGSVSPGQTHAAQQNGAQQNGAQTPSAKESNPSGDIPDSQVYVPYTAAGGLYTVKVPEGWARTQEGAATVFTDKLNTVRVEAQPVATAPTVVSARSQELPKIQATAHGFSGGDVTTVQRKAGPAIRITYRADSAPNPVTGKSVADAVERYDFWKNGQQVVLTLSGPTGADNVDPWRIVTDSLRWNR